jgi:hypothetical protein
MGRFISKSPDPGIFDLKKKPVFNSVTSALSVLRLKELVELWYFIVLVGYF